MNKQDIKQISDEMVRLLDPIYKDLDEIKENLDAARGDIFQLQDDVKGIRVQISLVTEKLGGEMNKVKKHIGMPVSETTET